MYFLFLVFLNWGMQKNEAFKPRLFVTLSTA